MIRLKDTDREYTVYTQLNEITLCRFAELTKLVKKEYEFEFDLHVDSIIALSDGLTLEYLDTLPHTKVQEIIDATKAIEYNDLILHRTFTFEGIEYITGKRENEFEFSAGEFRLLQKLANIDQVTNYKTFAAILFREQGGDLTPESIAARAEIFDNAMTIDVLYPYIGLFHYEALKYYGK